VIVTAAIVVAVSLTLAPAAFASPEAECVLIGYDADQRPSPADVPTVVSVGLFLLDLFEIDDHDQSVSMDMLWSLRWHDPRLAAFAGCRFPIGAVWFPDLHLLNAGSFRWDETKLVDVGEGGEVRYRLRFQGSLQSPHSLEAFPFDRRTIRVEVGSLRTNVDELELRVDQDVSGERQSLAVPNWTVEPGRRRVERHFEPALRDTFSTYYFELQAHRHAGYFVWKVIVLLSLIVVMSFGVFWIDPEQPEPQVALAAMSVLAIVAFHFALNDLVPHVSYLTRLDEFILGSSLLVFLSLIQAVTTTHLASTGRSRSARSLDQASRWAFPVAFIVVLVVAFVI
jgi:hypothetical protein